MTCRTVELNTAVTRSVVNITRIDSTVVTAVSLGTQEDTFVRYFTFIGLT
jgi:hypothetical protein